MKELSRRSFVALLIPVILFTSVSSGAVSACETLRSGKALSTVGSPAATITWDLPWGLDADPASVNIWTYPGDGITVTLADVDWTMPSGLLIWHYGGPAQGWQFYKKGWGAVNTLTALVPSEGYIGIVPTAGAWDIGHVDTTEPVISDIGVLAITQTSATVTWSTDERATSLVEYGTTANYGMSSVLDTNLVTSHSVALTGLTADTRYHFRVKSSDSSGNWATSGDATFDTSPVLALPVFTILSEQTLTQYQYDENGKLIGAHEYGTIQVSDGLGNTCTGTVTVTYTILAGKAKPLRKTITVPYDYGDTSRFASSLEPVPIVSPVEFVLDYQYDENGRLLGGTTHVTLENVGAAGDVTATCEVSTTTCRVIFHMARGERVKLTAHLPSTALSGYSPKRINWEWRPTLASDIAQGQVDVERL
jgi:hypothetical protein